MTRNAPTWRGDCNRRSEHTAALDIERRPAGAFTPCSPRRRSEVEVAAKIRLRWRHRAHGCCRELERRPSAAFFLVGRRASKNLYHFPVLDQGKPSRRVAPSLPARTMPMSRSSSRYRCTTACRAARARRLDVGLGNHASLVGKNVKARFGRSTDVSSGPELRPVRDVDEPSPRGRGREAYHAHSARPAVKTIEEPEEPVVRRRRDRGGARRRSRAAAEEGRRDRTPPANGGR